MKRNIAEEVKGIMQIAKMVGVNELVVIKKSTWASAQYKPVEMIRGDYDTVLNWCLAHQDDPEFDNDYVSQYVINVASKWGRF